LAHEGQIAIWIDGYQFDLSRADLMPGCQQAQDLGGKTPCRAMQYNKPR
jgi:hypothetical protein